MHVVAIQYTCRNPGQTALLWVWQPAPFGHGWIDVKAEPLVRLSEVEAIARKVWIETMRVIDQDIDLYNPVLDEVMTTYIRELLK